MILTTKQQIQRDSRSQQRSSIIRQNNHHNRQLDISRQRTTSPQIRIYNRNVYLRQAYKSMMNKKYEEEIEKMANSEKLDIGSYRILKEKVERYIDQTIKRVKKYTMQQQRGERQQTQGEQQQVQLLQGLSYQQMCQIIYTTNNYIRLASKTVQVQRLLSQIWLYLKNYDVQSQFLPIQVLSTFLNLLMDPKGLRPGQIQQLMMTIQPFERTAEMKSQFVNKYPELKDQALDDIEIFKLWFAVKQKHHLFPKHQRSTSSLHKHITQQQPRFQPTINQHSRVIAQKSLNKYLSSQNNPHYKLINTSNEQENELHQYLSSRMTTQQLQQQHDGEHGKLREKESSELNYHEILYRRKLQKELITQKVSESNYRSEQQQNARKATPLEVKQIVEKMYFVPQKKSDVDHKALKQQQELKACTFFPTMTHSPIKKNQNVSVPGFQKEVNRLKKGREEKLKLKQTYENLGRPKNLTSRSRTPSFIQRDIPKLILQVNIGAGRIQKIKLQGNQDPKIVAKKFINKHNLESSMMSVLQQLIDQNLRNL